MTSQSYRKQRKKIKKPKSGYSNKIRKPSLGYLYPINNDKKYLSSSLLSQYDIKNDENIGWSSGGEHDSYFENPIQIVGRGEQSTITNDITPPDIYKIG